VISSGDTIGVFDSGIGGVSVLRAIRARLPAPELAYVSDSAYVPYGGRAEGLIRDRCRSIAAFLLERGARMLVVACNTATAAAVPWLRDELDVPIVGMEPAVKPAAAATRSGTVGVLATVGTLRSARFAALLDQFGAGVEVLTEPCPGLVEAVERGELDSPATRAMVIRHLDPLLAGGADTIILGCTHYHFLRPVIESAAGEGIVVIDTAAAVARQVQRRLAETGLDPAAGSGRQRFFTSGDLASYRTVLQRLWPDAGPARALPDRPAL
jgi:glutamate racemase